MKNLRNIPVLLIAVLMCGISGVAFAQSNPLTEGDIFGCNNIGGSNTSSGTLSALASTYVPVYDSAITLNTGIVTYKECVLEPTVRRLRKAATERIAAEGLQGFLTGNNGNAYFPQNLNADIAARSDETVLNAMNQIQTVNPAFRDKVRSTVVRAYLSSSRTNDALKCDYNGDLAADISNPTSRPFSFSNFQQFMNPACNPFGAAALTQVALNKRIDSEVGQMLLKLQMNNGFYGVEHIDPQTGERITDTPGAIVGSNATQWIQSGFTQLENADDIGEMVGSMYAGIPNRVLSGGSSGGGLSGFAVGSGGGQSSFLDQLINQSNTDSATVVGNAALNILRKYLNVENRYLAAEKAIEGYLTSAADQLRSREQQCWDLVVFKNDSKPKQHVCAAQPASGTCTGTVPPSGLATPQSERVATTTVESQQVIQSQINPVLTPTRNNITASQNNISRIQSLIGQAAATSPNAQAALLNQIDQLVPSFHQDADMQNAEQRQGETQSSMNTLVSDTVRTWADGNDPNKNWCNVQNPAVIQRWVDAWKI